MNGYQSSTTSRFQNAESSPIHAVHVSWREDRLTQLREDDGQTGRYVLALSGGLRRRCPKVGFEEIVTHLLQARLWMISDCRTNTQNRISVGPGLKSCSPRVRTERPNRSIQVARGLQSLP